MTNPINPVGRSTVSSISSQAEKTQAKSKADSSTVSSVSTDDTVSLSQKSQQVLSLQQKLIDSPAVNKAKVDAIKQEIANGNYPLDAEKIAENMINLELSLLE